MSCNIKIPLQEIIVDVSAALSASFIKTDNAVLNEAVLNNVTLRGGVVLDTAARDALCEILQACNITAEELVWLAKPETAGLVAVSSTGVGGLEVNWEVFDDLITNGIVGKVSAEDVLITSGGNQAGKNMELRDAIDALALSRSVTPFDFGAIGDGVYHPLSERFLTLELAKVKYPHATAITDSIDWAALQAFFNYCHSTQVPHAVATCNAFINKPLRYTGALHKTNVMYGELFLKTEQPLDYMLHITGQRFQFLGTIDLTGASGAAKDRSTRHGLLLGYSTVYPMAVEDSYSPNLHIDFVDVSQTYDTGVYWGNFSHFSSIGRVRGSLIGSCITDNASVSYGATFTSATTVPGDINQSSTLVVDKLPKMFTATAMAYIGTQLYNINSFDAVNKTITIYPRLPNGVTSGSIWYQQGATVFTVGNDTSNLRIGTLQAITCGIGIDVRSLYGVAITTFVSEYLGAGVVITNRNNISIGNIIIAGYFEANIADIMYGWNARNSILPVLTSVALDPAKIKDLYSFRADNGTMLKEPSIGGVAIAGETYNALDNLLNGDVTSPQKVHFATFWGDTILYISQDTKKIPLFLKNSALYVYSGAYGTSPPGIITVNPGAGNTVNNAATMQIDASKYAGKSIMIHVYATGDTAYFASVITPENVVADIRGGPTTSRPVGSVVGKQYFDTDLNKLIIWNGSAWVNPDGTALV